MDARALKNRRKPVLIAMLLPCAVVLGLIVLTPMINLVWYSLHDYKLTNIKAMRFVGLSNYVKAFGDGDYLHSIKITAQYVLRALATQLPVALVLVEVLQRIKRGSGLVRTLLLPTMVVPPVIAGVMWRIMYHPSYGLVNYILGAVGLAHNWTSDPATALGSLVFIDFWQNLPFLTLILLAGRASISEDVYEAAMIDGAGALSSFWHITLPLLRGSLLLGVLFRMIDCIKVFPTVHIVTAGGPGTATTMINYYIYKMAFNYTNIGYSSAMGFILVVLTTLLSVALIKAFQK